MSDSGFHTHTHKFTIQGLLMNGVISDPGRNVRLIDLDSMMRVGLGGVGSGNSRADEMMLTGTQK